MRPGCVACCGHNRGLWPLSICEGATLGLGRIIPLRLPLLLIGGFISCVSALAPASGIVGGAPVADPATSGAVVLVASPSGACSGVAIAPDLVLTAAHCIGSGRPYAISAPGEPTTKKAWALQIFRHRTYSAAPRIDAEPRIGADLALLKLAADISPAPVVLSAKDAVQIADRFVIIGFGRIDSGGGGPVMMPRSATLVLQSGLSDGRTLVLADPATYGKSPGLGSCYGDSGGPVFEGTSGKLALIGIVTSGKCGLSTIALVLEPYIQWIFDTATIVGSTVVQL